LTKLVRENITDWDEHLFTMLFSYKIAYKVATRYTPYQLVYGLHPLMLIKYIIPNVGGNDRDSILVKALTTKITKFEKLQKVKKLAIDYTGIQQWNKTF
jgi:hypothetical protein